MFPWKKLNKRGKALYGLSVFNICIAFVFAFNFDLSCILSTVVAMFCGFLTFDPSYHK